MELMYEYEGYKEHGKKHKQNREFFIKSYLFKYENQVEELYFYLKMRYLEHNKDMFLNNSTARKHLKEEENQLIDIMFEKEVDKYYVKR